MGNSKVIEPPLGEILHRVDVCALSQVRRVAAMLSHNPDDLSEGMPLPRGWHFFLLGGDTTKSNLREDGFPGFGVPMPDLPFPRLLLGGRTVAFSGDIIIGERIERVSKIIRLDIKEASAIVTFQHELRGTNSNLVETQTYILLPKGNSEATSVSKPVEGYSITPDSTMLFQYSALGFNSHKIHLDKNYTRDVEGLPDLVVNGGLVTLLALEYLRQDLGIVPLSLKTRHSAPLYCDRPLHFTLQPHKLTAFNNEGLPSMEMEFTL